MEIFMMGSAASSKLSGVRWDLSPYSNTWEISHPSHQGPGLLAHADRTRKRCWLFSASSPVRAKAPNVIALS